MILLVYLNLTPIATLGKVTSDIHAERSFTSSPFEIRKGNSFRH